MSQILKPRTASIEWGNPLTKRLIIDIPLFERGSTKAAEIAKGRSLSFTGTPSWVNTPIGSGGSCNGSTDGIISTIDPDLTAIKDGWTSEVWFIPASIAGEQVMFNTARVNDNGLNSIEIESSKIKFLLNGVTRVDSGVTPVVGNLYQAVVRRLNGTSSIFVNGVQGTGTSASNPDGQTVNNVNLGCARSNGTTLFRFFNGTIILGRHWERALSTPEIRKLYENPFQIYKKPL